MLLVCCSYTVSKLPEATDVGEVSCRVYVVDFPFILVEVVLATLRDVS